MTTLLIKTQQRWIFRAIDVFLTILAWCGFLYLFITGFIAVLQKKSSADVSVHFGLLWATIDTLFIYLLIGIINAVILFAWAYYNKKRRGVERRSSIPVITDEDLLNSFQLAPAHLAVLRQHRVVTIRNDEHGHITDISYLPHL